MAGPKVAMGQEEDSPSTDAEMPPLVPVVSIPAPPPAVPPKSVSQLLAIEALARRGRARKGKAKAKSKGPAVPVPEVEAFSAAPIFVGPGAAAPGASPKTVDFSRRAGDLAAMLDQLPAPSLEAVDSSQIPERKRWTDRAREEIEVSAAATAKAAASQQDELLNPADLMNADASDSEGEDEMDEDDDDEDEENAGKTSSRSRCRRPKLSDLREVPPGAPAAESAGEEVLHAVAAAGGVAPEPGGSSFGPRFKNLSKSQLKDAREKWQLHSLAGVETTSSEQNRRAAEELFAALKARKTTPEEPVASPAKPVFRKRGIPAPEAETPATRPEAFTTPGVRILEECVAGRGIRRKAETVPNESARPVAKRRKGVVIAGEDGEDGED